MLVDTDVLDESVLREVLIELVVLETVELVDVELEEPPASNWQVAPKSETSLKASAFPPLETPYFVPVAELTL